MHKFCLSILPESNSCFSDYASVSVDSTFFLEFLPKKKPLFLEFLPKKISFYNNIYLFVTT